MIIYTTKNSEELIIHDMFTRQVLLLGELILPQMPGLVPFITFGSLCLVAAVLVLYLPETLGTKLPDTIEEAVAQARVSPGHQTMNRAAGQQGSSASLDVGYGKCPEFVCVDGLIVSKDNAWGDGGSDSGQEQSLSMSHQGTLSTLRWVTERKLENSSMTA